ncbi:MAG: IMP dehydrogenase, partial [Candidatus Diapherotrites archaeon]|nr:IMP dehydrogenase [Candidatus Diapherotrites archaeon]
IVKAIAAGASAVMIGSLFAGCAESPGREIFRNGRKFKQYRGMGSLGAMSERNSTVSDRYFHAPDTEIQKLVPEGIEGVVPFKGPMGDVVFQLLGGLRSGMGLVGARTVSDLNTKSRWRHITAAGLAESHPHNVFITEESPNYRPG